jgi:UDP-N-acetylglucosamine:LPS N-acetylglucosamine transferase
MNNIIKEKIIFTTGGTGGHIYPALAIAKEFKKKERQFYLLVQNIEWREK